MSLDPLLIQEIHDNQENVYIYKFASPYKKEIQKILEEVEKIEKGSIKSINKVYI